PPEWDGAAGLAAPAEVVARSGPSSFDRFIHATRWTGRAVVHPLFQGAGDQVVGELRGVRRVPDFAPPDVRLRFGQRFPIRRTGGVDSITGRQLSHRNRRHRSAAGDADHARRMAGGPFELERDYHAAEGILRLLPGAPDRNAWRLHGARCAVV